MKNKQIDNQQDTTNLDRNIYALTDIAPETQAYALARYSRSAASLRESVAWITEQKAADFLETFYFAYGHKSIADMAHVTLALENISILAAIEVENEQLWDGQERSTRYQDFTKSRYVIPPELDNHLETRQLFVTTADMLFNTYEVLTKELVQLLTDTVPRPADMDLANYKRTINARALDVTRTLLPYAARTSVGQVTSARVLERQLSRLLGSQYSEIRQVAEEMKATCKQPAFSPLYERVQSRMAELVARYPEAQEALAELAKEVEPTAPAPTLVKYAEANKRDESLAELLKWFVTTHFEDLPYPVVNTVGLSQGRKYPIMETVATLLYKHCHLSYLNVQMILEDIAPTVIKGLYTQINDLRGKHDGLLLEQQVGQTYVFDILLDGKSMQDFFRHRRCTQIRQDITPQHGFEFARQWFTLGLPVEVLDSAFGDGLGMRYDAAMLQAAEAVEEIAKVSESASHYLLPLGYKRRALFKMDAAQAAYMIETRSQPAGHFAYRKAACEMWEQLNRVQPEIAKGIRVTPFESVDFLKR
jgi:thymidylate synthase ThyX